MAQTLSDVFAVRQVSPEKFESMYHPEKMGNTANIAYGGCALAVATNVAHHGVPSDCHLYSFVGHYLGPALTDRNFDLSLRDVRTTRTFKTRQVEVSQRLDNGQQRLCLIVLADFQKAEPATLLAYSKPPAKRYSVPDKLHTTDDFRRTLVANGTVSESEGRTHAQLFGLARLFDSRTCPEGIAAQNLLGVAKNVKTTQHSLPLHSKTSADWIKNGRELETPAHHLSALAFVMDGAISFIPLTHSGLFLDDASACSSLDFALRVFSNNVDLNKWHLRELKTIAGGHGRTYSESQLWDAEGNMVASMTQQSILRPASTKQAKL